jgi:hypothetical protein
VVADLETEIGKRRDLRDELDRQTERRTETRQQTRNNSKVIQQCIAILGAEGEHLDSVRILIIKKKGCTMRNFYGAPQPFQQHNHANNQITSITSAGPVWQVECKSPMATRAIRDACWNYCQQNNIEATVIKGKSNITTAKERVVVGTSDSITKILRIDKPKGKGKGPQRIITGWPDQNNQFSVIADNFVMVAGRINFDKMEYELMISKRAASGEQVAQQLAHQIRAFDSNDRVGYLLPISIELVADLDNNEWGRRQRGMLQQQGAAAAMVGQRVVGQPVATLGQQQQLAQPGAMAAQHDPWAAAASQLSNSASSASGQQQPLLPGAAAQQPTYANTPATAVGPALAVSYVT